MLFRRRPSCRAARPLSLAIDALEDRRLMAVAPFAQPVSIATGNNPMDIAAADLNNDGRQDLVVVSSDPLNPGFYVHLGNGQGGFGTGVRVAMTYNPQAIVTGDFDRDGKADVAVAGTALLGLAGAVQVFKGLGTGLFAPAQTYAAGLGTNAISAADLNGDGRLDLVATNPLAGTLAIFTAKSDGTFNSASFAPAAATPVSAVLGDFNEDGKIDAVVTSLLNVSLMTGKGDGTFNAATAVYGFPQTLTIQTVRAYADDLNHDGHLDLLVPNLSGTVARLDGRGDGTFASPAQSLAAPAVKGVASIADDFNDDGAGDVATLDYAGGQLVFDAGATATAAATRTVYAIGASPSAIEFADVNGDGHLDIVVTNSADDTVSLLLNQATSLANGLLDRVARRLDLFGTDAADDIAITETGSQLVVNRNGLISSYTRADFDFVYLNAGLGDDRVDFSTVRTSIYASGGYGNDTILAGLGNDTLFGSLGNDVLDGGAGNDRIGGWKGNDTLFGGEGEDRLYGDQNNDRLDGNSGRDRMWGGDGNDTLNGGQSNDRLYGEAGDDVLAGSIGNDVLSGGDGRDKGDVHVGDLVDSIEVVID